MKDFNSSKTIMPEPETYKQGIEDLKTEVETLLDYSETPVSSEEVYDHFESDFSEEDNFYSEDELSYVADALVQLRREETIEQTAFLKEDGAKIGYRLSE